MAMCFAILQAMVNNADGQDKMTFLAISGKNNSDK